ncbi:hypothetical protein DPMN_085014 [Dreissena polymorpha]|uniref:Uncharacterized protein n=1 Tax=Dreissena polymorpha TaxID=45954 RepID=A0A9D3YCU5_DREPO|nr:hypothetical protein DPMN_085014 [Dreissena polymorpha]
MLLCVRSRGAGSSQGQWVGVGWVVVLPDTSMFLLLVDGESVRVFQDDPTLPTCHRGGHTVGFDVFLELHVPGCSVATHGTFVGFLFGVCPHVRLQLVSLHAGERAYRCTQVNVHWSQL